MASAAPLPPGLLQFSDQNGAPYAGGQVITYVPGGTTPKTTWQDPNQTTANENPIPLDAAGRCNIWGSGQYRMQLWDADGNLIFDQLTEASDSGSSAPFTGDSGTGGTDGLVPAPPAGSAATWEYLAADGNWSGLNVVVPNAPLPIQAGFLFVPQRLITSTSGALVLTDAGGNISYQNGGNGVLTITKDSTANWLAAATATTAGVITQIMISNLIGSGNLVLHRDTGVSLVWPGTSATSADRTLAVNGQCLLSRIGINSWTVAGVGLS